MTSRSRVDGLHIIIRRLWWTSEVARWCTSSSTRIRVGTRVEGIDEVGEELEIDARSGDHESV
jgi:hypothetical protein